MHMCVPIINVIITSNSNTIRQYGHWSRFRLGFKVDAANLPQAASGVMYSTVRFAWYVYVEPEPNHEQEQAHTNLRYCFIYKLQYTVLGQSWTLCQSHPFITLCYVLVPSWTRETN